MKRASIFRSILIIIGVLIISLTLFGIQVFAAEGISVSSSDFTVHQGETFTTTIHIPDEANLVDFEMTLKYDTDLVTLVSAEENDDIKGSVIFNTETAGEIPINYSRTDKNVTSYLPILDLTFRVDDEIGIGSYDLFSVDTNETFVAHRLNTSGSRSEIEFNVEFPSLVIYEMGDVDLNGKIDIGDATDIRRHLAHFSGSILKDFRLSLADVCYDEIIDIADPIILQRRLAKFNVIYGNRVNVYFINMNGDKYAAKSVVYDGTLNSIPAVPSVSGYSGGIWSASPDELVEPDYTHLTKNTYVYAFYTGHDDPAMDYYKKVLTNTYYSGDMPTNLSSNLPLPNMLTLQNKLYYQEGRYAMLTWASSCNYVINSVTGDFKIPTYPTDVSLTVTITSYDSDNRIESEGEITFEYQVPGIYRTPTKEEIADFLYFYFTDASDDTYRVNYDVKLLQKINNTVLPTEGALYDNFEVRLNWFQNVDGSLVPVSQIKRTTSSQINDYVAVATFNGKPIDGDGKIYIDNVTVTAIDQMEIKNYIIQQIAAKQGTLATDGTSLWNNDTVYGTTVTWETGNADIAYVANNAIQLKDDAVSGATLPLNARVSYAVDGGVEEFVLAYNLTVSCDNTIIKAPENMDPGLYKAIKMELEDTLGYRGDLTSAALANVKFVNLDLSKYQQLAKEYEILRAEHPEQYPDDTYPEILSFRGLSYCKNLRTLNISGIEIADASLNQIATLSYLEAFIARGCNLDNLSDGGTATLRNATGLKLLDLTDNNFTSLDSVFAPGVRYGSLREVYLSKNKLTDINALSRAPMMTYLSLSENGLTTEGTASIANYPYLVYLSLAHNNIDSVEHLKNLKFLKELRLQYNNLSNVNELRRLVNLEALYLGHNKIKDVGNLNTLTALQILYVNDNEIFDISNLSDLTKLEAINVNNNKIPSLAVLANYKSKLTEIYAENNLLTDFSFINGASKLHILMLAGNEVELAQANMTTWLGGLSEMQILTLSDIRLNDLSFLASMSKLVRLDVANCGLTTFNGADSNIQQIADRYATLKVLDISNNDFSDGETELQNLRNVTLLTVFYADNICDSLDAYTLTYSMTELRYISLENCGITTMNWLSKFNNLVYVDLAGNNVSDVSLEGYFSNASIKTLKELYLDTNVPCSFANAYRVMDFNVEKLSLEGITLEKMEYMPYLDNIRYLNISKTGLHNLTGSDPELEDLYSIERYTTMETVDVSYIDSDISVLENIGSIDTVYAVGTTDSRRFYENNLHTLQRLYNKEVTCHLYDKENVYEPVATVEGTDILNLIDDISCNVTVAADNVLSDNNPFLIDEINDFDITWSVSNESNYEIVNNHLGVKNYSGIEDETLTVTATITVYPDQASVSRNFTVNTHILRADTPYFEIDATGYSENLTRDSAFNYSLTLKAAETEGFANPVKPVEDNIDYSYSVITETGSAMPYPNALTVMDGHRFAVASNAPLNSTITISIDICHRTSDGSVVNDFEQINRSITVVSRTFSATFVMDGGTIVDNQGLSRESIELVEDSLIFENLSYVKPGYVFEGWYTDAEFTDLFSLDGTDAVMPSHNLTLYAKWTALSYNVIFDANGGEVSITTKQALSDVELGELPVPTRQYYTFDGWFTAAENGDQVTAESKFARTDDLTIYAHWTLNSFIVTFDANGGTVGTSSIRAYCGQKLGSLPTPTRDYYTFNGWYTAGQGGELVTANKTYDLAVDVTLYAHWTINATSGWVIASEAPSDAQITNTKYSYTHRYYTTHSPSPLYDSSWTNYETRRTGWSAWSDWSTSNPSNGVRNVESRSVYDHTEYHYYRWTNGYSTYTYKYNSSYHLEETWFSYILPVSQYGTAIGYVGSDTGPNLWARADYAGNRDVDKTWSRSVNRTEYRYQEPVYTYYYYKDIVEEGATQPSGSEYTNIVKWVQYRPKTVNTAFSQIASTTYGGHTYILYSCSTTVTWADAKIYCEMNGGYLATITSAAEESAINSIAAGYKSWFGLSKTPATNWTWVTGETFSYANWASGEPSSSDGLEYYGGTYTDDKWNDYRINTWSVSCFIMEKAN